MMEDNNEGLSERLIMVRDHFNYNNTEFAKVCGFSSSAMDSLLKGTNKDTKTTYVGNISIKLGIDLNWLINGEGEMFKEGAKVNSNHNIISKSKDVKKNIQSQGGVTTANTLSEKDEVVKLREEVVFLKEQLKFTQGLLQDALKK